MWRFLFLVVLALHGYWCYASTGYDDFIVFRLMYAVTVGWQFFLWLAKRQGRYRPYGKGLRSERE